MQLDFRCFIKFRDPEAYASLMQRPSFEADDGSEFTLAEIAAVFTDPNRLDEIMKPIGMVFDTVSASSSLAFCFLHDRNKSYGFFRGLVDYLAGEFSAVDPEGYFLIADLTDIDTDATGNRLFWCFNGVSSSIGSHDVPGPQGLEQHMSVEISEIRTLMGEAWDQLSGEERSRVDAFMAGQEFHHLMDHFQFTEGLEAFLSGFGED